MVQIDRRLRPSASLVAIAALAAAGCSRGDRTVTVTSIDRIWQEDATAVSAPSDAITAVRLLPADGAAPLRGAKTAAATWTVGQVPAGTYRLDVTYLDGHHVFLDADADAIDLGGDGLPLLAQAGAGTSAEITLDGLQPWDGAANWLQYYVHAVGGADAFYLGLPEGETSFAGFFGWPFGPKSFGGTVLLEPADVVHAVQQRDATVVATGDTVRAAIGWASARGGSITTSGGTLPPLHFAPTAATGTIRLRWSAQAFAAAAPGSNAAVGYSLAVRATPAPGLAHRARGLELLSVWSTAGVVLADRDDGTATYGRAVPPGWTEYLDATFWRREERLAPGATRPLSLALVTTLAALPGAYPDPIAPAVTAVRDVTVGGRDASVVQAGVGDGPAIAWAAPAIGVPTSVRVELRELVPDDPYRSRLVAAFVTTRAAVQVPAGTLQAGKSYVARLRTVASPSDRPGEAPFRLSPPWTQVELLTQVFTP